MPKVRMEALSQRGPDGPVVAVSVSHHSGKDPIALSDLSVWRRKGTGNTTIQARARPIRKQTDAHVEDKLEIRDEVSVEVVRNESADEENIPDRDLIRPKATADYVAATAEDRKDDHSNEDPDFGAESLGPTEHDHDFGSKGTAQVPRQIGSSSIISREASDEELALNADEYAQVIAGVLLNADDDERMSFALFGHWGRGKTYLTGRVIPPASRAAVSWARRMD